LAAEIERNLISQRTKSSLANLKATGKKLGRPLASESQKLKLSKNSKKIRNLLSKGISKSQIAKILGVQRSTLRRFIERNNYSN
jgi:DNA invertase Pin-like site-specific DNA recombinase